MSSSSISIISRNFPKFPNALLTKSEFFIAMEKLQNAIDFRRIVILPTQSVVTPDTLRQAVTEGRICACDFYIEGIEKEESQYYGDSPVIKDSYGIQRAEFLNIDHHSSLPEMRAMISSGNLAVEYKNTQIELPDDFTVVVNHSDCDSVSSSLIILGIFDHCYKKDEIFKILGEAVKCADHSGEPNVIADLLQGMESQKNFKLSAEALITLLTNEFPDFGRAMYAKRMDLRDAISELILNPNAVKKIGNIVVVKSDSRLESELIAPFFPDAYAIISSEPKPSIGAGHTLTRIRLCTRGIESRLSLLDLGINYGPDPININWGGRWNAGSDSRGGGSPRESSLEKMAYQLNERIEEYLKNNSN